MIAINIYDAAKIIAIIVVAAVVLTILSAPIQFFIAVDHGLMHLRDNGYGPLWLIFLPIFGAMAYMAFKRRWWQTGAALAVAVATGGVIVYASSQLAGDAVAYGSERNEQWAMGLAGEPEYASIQWLYPPEMRDFVSKASVSCCTSEFVLRDEGSYPKAGAFGMRVGAYTLIPHTALRDYIELASGETGDWLAYYASCVVAPKEDLEAFGRKAGEGAMRRIAHEQNLREARRPDSCRSLEGMNAHWGIDLRGNMERVIAADGGRPAQVLASQGLGAACDAHERCARFERDFAVEVQ